MSAADGMIGLIGGMSWESSALYYRQINEAVRDARGPAASARCLLWSFDFAEIARLQAAGEWDALTHMMIDAARRLEAAGAGILMICANTMHRMAPEVAAAVSIPLLHIADPVGDAIRKAGLTRVALLGTAFTMEGEFYRARLAELHGLDVIVPDADDRATIHRIIYDELVAGVIRTESRTAYGEVIGRLVTQGAEAVILGCTEIALLLRPEDSPVPLFDTAALHAAAAARWVLGKD